MRRSTFPALVVSLAVLASGCGGDGDDDDASTTTTAAVTIEEGDGTSSTVGGDGGSGTPSEGTPPDDGGDGTTPPGDGAAVGPLDASSPAPDLTSGEICTRLSAAAASAALGIAEVTAEPGASGTPQCSYRFEGANGTPTDATVAALRSAGDLGDRYGDEAFAFVVDLNKSVASGEVTETPLTLGNNAVILSGGSLHMAIVQLGGRVITVLLAIDAGSVEQVAALATAAAGALAP